MNKIRYRCKKCGESPLDSSFDEMRKHHYVCHGNGFSPEDIRDDFEAIMPVLVKKKNKELAR